MRYFLLFEPMYRAKNRALAGFLLCQVTNSKFLGFIYKRMS